MRGGPAVSVVIPTYNRESAVCEAVDSVLAQTYPGVEIIVVDDGSKDNTLDRLARYRDRIRVAAQENAGPSAARNRGAAMARGELIGFLDSDDLWLPEKIEKQVSLLERAGPEAPCCLCNISMRWRDREESSFDVSGLRPDVEAGLWLNPAETLAARFVLFNQAVLVRRKAFERVRAFDESLSFLEDYELALRLSLEGPWAFLKEPLVIWRQTAGSCTERAQSEETALRQTIERILWRQLGRVAEERGEGLLQEITRAEWERARRYLYAARLVSERSGIRRIAGRALLRLEDWRRSAYRRSPWFPGMATMALGPGWQGRHALPAYRAGAGEGVPHG